MSGSGTDSLGWILPTLPTSNPNEHSSIYSTLDAMDHGIKKIIWNGHEYRQSHWVMLTVTVCILFCVHCTVHVKGSERSGRIWRRTNLTYGATGPPVRAGNPQYTVTAVRVQLHAHVFCRSAPPSYFLCANCFLIQIFRPRDTFTHIWHR